MGDIDSQALRRLDVGQRRAIISHHLEKRIAADKSKLDNILGSASPSSSYITSHHAYSMHRNAPPPYLDSRFLLLFRPIPLQFRRFRPPATLQSLSGVHPALAITLEEFHAEASYHAGHERI